MNATSTHLDMDHHDWTLIEITLHDKWKGASRHMQRREAIELALLRMEDAGHEPHVVSPAVLGQKGLTFTVGARWRKREADTQTH